MRFVPSALAFVTTAALAGLASPVRAQSKSQSLTIRAPATIRVNTDVTFALTLRDGWTDQPLAGRLIDAGVGEEFYLSAGGSASTSNTGAATFRWRFSRPGRYRVVAFSRDGYGYLSQRTTLLVTVR